MRTFYRQHRVEFTRVMTKEEIRLILEELKSQQGKNAFLNRIIFRLATCCGLRVSEISKLQMNHVRLESSRPHLALPAHICKFARPRKVPIHWDRDTLDDIHLWKNQRLAHGAAQTAPFLCAQAKNSYGKPLSRRNIQFRFKRLLRILGAERMEELSVHSGRHSFCTHALAGGRNLIEVRNAAGHSNIATTSAYLHLLETDESVGSLFSF